MIRKQTDDYIDFVCHELKTPLAMLNATLQLMSKKLDRNQDISITQCIDTVDQQVKKMSHLVNSFLNRPYLETGILHLSEEKFKLDILIGQLIAESRQLKSTHFVYLDSPGHTDVYADREKISCVINNFLGNAMKYSPEGKTIYISCIKSPKEVRVRFRDQGPGIKPEYLGKLFEIHYRVGAGIDHSIPGLGIGLYLCAKIIKQHGGRIWAESEFGYGSVFYFTLPCETGVEGAQNQQ